MNSDSAALARALRGPVALITLGTLFALDHFSRFSIEVTWPALLIILGLLGLAGGIRPRSPQSSNQGATPSPNPNAQRGGSL